MTEIRKCSNRTYHSFKVLLETGEHLCTIGAFGDNSFEALNNAKIFFSSVLKEYEDPDKLKYQHHSSWSKSDVTN